MFPHVMVRSLPLPTTQPPSNTTIPTTAINSQGSWFSQALTHIPGYNWLKTKIGRFFYGPTFAMTPSELRAWKISQDRAYYIESLKIEKESDFKSAMFMAEHFPAYYWVRYIQEFEPGSEERKRGLFLLVLINQRLYGNYYGTFYQEHIDKEFEEMGVSLKDNNVIQALVGDVLRKRAAQDIFWGLTEEDVEIFNEVKQELEGTSISSLSEKMKQQSTPRKKRRINNNDEELSTFVVYN